MLLHVQSDGGCLLKIESTVNPQHILHLLANRQASHAQVLFHPAHPLPSLLAINYRALKGFTLQNGNESSALFWPVLAVCGLTHPEESLLVNYNASLLLFVGFIWIPANEMHVNGHHGIAFFFIILAVCQHQTRLVSFFTPWGHQDNQEWDVTLLSTSNTSEHLQPGWDCCGVCLQCVHLHFLLYRFDGSSRRKFNFNPYPYPYPLHIDSANTNPGRKRYTTEQNAEGASVLWLESRTDLLLPAPGQGAVERFSAKNSRMRCCVTQPVWGSARKQWSKRVRTKRFPLKAGPG